MTNEWLEFKAYTDALVLGPIRTEAVVLPDEALQKIKAYGANAKQKG